MLLQFAVTEIVILLVVALLVFGVPLALVAVLAALYLRSKNAGDLDERVDELEAEVAALRAEVGDESADGGTVRDGSAEDVRRN